MKKITYLILFVSCFSFAQTDDVYEAALGKISEAYNAKNSEALFNMFSDDFKAQFPLDKVTSFMTDTHAAKGKMAEHSFLVDADDAKHYLVEFEEISSLLILKVSADTKIMKLKLEEY